MPRLAPDPLDRIIGANLRRLRIARDMSQAKLGYLIGVSFQQVQKYENGQNGIRASCLARAATALGCTLAEFFIDPLPLAPS